MSTAEITKKWKQLRKWLDRRAIKFSVVPSGNLQFEPVMAFYGYKTSEHTNEILCFDLTGNNDCLIFKMSRTQVKALGQSILSSIADQERRANDSSN